MGVDVTCLEHQPGRWLWTLLRFLRLVRSMRPDVLHLHTGEDRLYGEAAAAVLGVPVVYHLHGRYVHLGRRGTTKGTRWRTLRRIEGPLFDRLERRVARQYIATSKDIEALFAPLVHAPITVLRQSVPLAAFRRNRADREQVRAELGLPPDEPLVLNVSRLVAGKGHHDLILMLERIGARSPECQLALVGDGELRDELREQAERMGLARRVHFLGNRYDVPRLLGAADVFTFASESEGFGLAVLEAMAAGLPVVSYRLPSLEEFVEHGRTGLMVELGDVDGLADATACLVENPALARRMGAAARLVVEERFPPDATARTFEHVYEAALGTAAKAPR